MKILLATHNQAKFERYGKILKSIPDLEVFSLADLEITEKVEENFETNVENALHKARTYGKISKIITVAVDESLMTNFLPDNEQPGVYARRFAKNKRELTDDELAQTWKEIFKLYPQENKQFIFDYAVAYFNPENNSEGFECVEKISYVTKRISSKKIRGYPVSSMISPIKNGEPYTEMDEKEVDKNDLAAFSKFVKKFDEFLKCQKYQ